LWVHLVFFSVLQVLAISSAIREHTTGMLAGLEYRWWWLFQDFFHLGGGIVLLTAAIGLLCTVTTKFEQFAQHTVKELIDSGCPPIKAAMCRTLLSAERVGMHVLGKIVFIDAKTTAAFVMLLVALLLQSCIEIANGMDYSGRHLRPTTMATMAQPSSGDDPISSFAEPSVPASSASAFECDVSQLGRQDRGKLLGKLIDALVAG